MKKLVYLFVLIPVIGLAQERFNRQIDLEFPFHVITSVLPTDSCYYATGVMTDTSDATNAIGNIFLKFDLEGELEFYKKLSTPNKSYQTWWGDLVTTPEGNFIDIGVVDDSTTKAVIIEYDINGDTILTRELPNPFYPENAFFYVAEAVRTDDDNLFILCRVDSDSLQNEKDIYLMKLDSDYELIDSFFYGNSGSDIPLSMLLDPTDGNIIIGSQKTNREQTTQDKYSRIHIFKVNQEGEMIWEYLAPSNQITNVANDLTMGIDDGIISVSGQGINHIINSSNSQLRWHSTLLKIGSGQELEWETEMRGNRHSASTGFSKVVSALDGSGYIATGRLIETISTGEEAFGSWVVKVSPEGDSLWARYYTLFDDIKSRPHPYDLKNTPDGGYVIVGETRPEDPPLAQRAWIMKLDQHGCLIPGCEEGDSVTASIDLPKEASLQLAIYPNPTSNFLNFQLRGVPDHRGFQNPGGLPQFRIIDPQGKVVKEIKSNGLKVTHIVPVSEWPGGVYFLQYMKNGEVKVSERFVVGK